ncbi:GH17785 [Drosophila grimshawi]|uniref:Protein-serine O-palmitoleoyltransferase porcupine n=1 Tax=Drosophila grimshawi TaxID=7222 RepID=B4JXQ7_DROGR|nr:GH17785 [Drosophila grimshawi]
MDYQYYDEEPDYGDDDADSSLSEDAYTDQEEQGTSEGHYVTYADVTDRLWDSYEHCILPSLHQVLGYIMPLMLGCLLCRLLSSIYASRRRLVASSTRGTSCSWAEANSLKLAPLHLINALCGLGVLYATLGQRMLILLLLSGISYLLLQLVRMGRGQRGATAIAVLSIGSQFIYELAIWQKRDDWPQLRGLQMVTNMKIISLGYDLMATPGSSALRMPNILAYLGYVLNPASCALGPWISYGRYLDSLHQKPHWRQPLPDAAQCGAQPGGAGHLELHCASAGSVLVTLTNLIFTLLAICHLAYLGVVLMNETLIAENELPFMYHWSAAGYLSHYVGIGMFVLYLIIS